MSATTPRRILMTGDTVGGVWTYSLQLIEALAPYGIEVTLVAMGGEATADQRHAAQALPNLRLIVSDLKLEWMPEPAANLRRADTLLRELEAAFAPDIVHVNGYANAAAGFAAPVVVVAHSCVPTWWRACRRAPLPPEWDGYQSRLREGIAAADCVVAPTGAFLASFSDIHGSPRRSVVIHNGRDPRRFRPGGKRPFALAAGRLWDEAKNIEALCRAAGDFSYPVLIAGDSRPATPAPANVRLLGRLDTAWIAAQMAEAAVFVAPARYEPFGLAILEAALSGCALVLGDIPTLRELWDRAASFVDPDETDALSVAVDRLLGEPARASAAGHAARRRALAYGAAATARGYVGLYREMLARAIAPVAEAAE